MMVKTLGLWWRFSLKPIHCWHRGWLRPAHDGRGETPGAVPTAPAAATGAKAAGRDGTEGGEGPLTKTIEAGWWFGTFSILGISWSQLTNSIIYQRGRYTTMKTWVMNLHDLLREFWYFKHGMYNLEC
jgi:hypothetical protein